MGAGSIQLSEILAYAEAYRITSASLREDMVRYVRILDNDFVRWMGEKHRQERKTAEAKSRAKPARRGRR